MISPLIYKKFSIYLFSSNQVEVNKVKINWDEMRIKHCHLLSARRLLLPAPNWTYVMRMMMTMMTMMPLVVWKMKRLSMMINLHLICHHMRLISEQVTMWTCFPSCAFLSLLLLKKKIQWFLMVWWIISGAEVTKILAHKFCHWQIWFVFPFAYVLNFVKGKMVFSLVSTSLGQCQTNGFSPETLFSADDKERDIRQNCCRRNRKE